MKPSLPENPFILFLHLQKTAGMTLQELLRKHYGKGALLRGIDRLRGRSKEGLPLDEALRHAKREDRMFVGHFCYGVHRLLDFPTTYITLLRDPVKRLISLYHYSSTNPQAHYYKVARHMSMEEFCLECRLLELDNGMTRFLAGDDEDLFINRTPYGECDGDMLRKAKANIERDFAFVGIQESFDESVLLLARVLGWDNPYYLTLNVRKNRDKVDAPGEAFLDRLREHNAMDIDLFAYCRDRFDREFTAAFPDGDEAVSRFRRENARYQRRVLPVQKLRMRLGRLLRSMTPGHGK